MTYVDLKDLKIDRNTLLKIAGEFTDCYGTCLLYSGGEFDTSERSFLCLFPVEWIEIRHGRQQRCHINGTCTEMAMENPWDAMKSLLPEIGKGTNSFPEWVGFFGYEMGAFSDKERLMPYFSASTPEAYWQRHALTLVVDHRCQRAHVCLAPDASECFSDQRKSYVKRLSQVEGWEELIHALENTALFVKKPLKDGLQWRQPPETIESYVNKIQSIQDMIRAGDVYQVNLSQCFEMTGQVHAFQLFLNLALSNPSPFSAYLHHANFTIISSSPERFLSKRGDILETRPIKGTAPRGVTPVEDFLSKAALKQSVKEKAELLMITDLMRNDLSQVSIPGSVITSALWQCESYANVFHLHSVVKSQAQAGLHPIDIIRACFPGGSITGCPKLNAIKAIYELEQRPRGIYTGAIGYLADNGDFDLNIAIRTCVAKSDTISISLGGGIVIDSDPWNEYQETMHKGKSIFNALGLDNRSEICQK